MGNSQSKAGSTLSDWEKVDTENGIQIFRNVKNHELAEKRTVVIDPQYDIDDQLRLYAIRENNNDALVRSLGTQNFNKAKNKKSQGGFCSEQRRLNVLTEKIPYRLSDMPQLTFPQSLHFLSESLRAYEVVYKKQGPVHVTGNLIGVNQHGEVKSWINQNWAMNHPSHELPTLQSTRLGSITKQDYISYGGKYRDQQEMVNNIMAVIQQKCEQGKFPKQFGQEASVHSTSFRKLRTFLHDFVEYNHIYIPPKINYETVVVSKYETRLVQQLNKGRQMQNSSQQASFNEQQNKSNAYGYGYNGSQQNNSANISGSVASGQLVNQLLHNQPHGYSTTNQHQQVTTTTTRYHTPVIHTSFGKSGVTNNQISQLPLSTSNTNLGHASLIQSQTVTRPGVTGFGTSNYNYNNSSYGYGYNNSNNKPTETTETATKLMLINNNAGGYKNTNPHNYEQFKQISKNSNLIDGLTGQITGGAKYGYSDSSSLNTITNINTNTSIKPYESKYNSSYNTNASTLNLNLTSPNTTDILKFNLPTTTTNTNKTTYSNNNNSTYRYTSNGNANTNDYSSGYLIENKDQLPPFGHYNQELNTNSLHGVYDYYKDLHHETTKVGSGSSVGVGLNQSPTFNNNNNSTCQSSYYTTSISKPVYQTTTFTKQYKVGSGAHVNVGDSINSGSSYDANYSSKFGTGSMGSSSGYGFGLGQNATTKYNYNTYAVGGGYHDHDTNNSYEPTYQTGLSGYSNTLLKYDNVNAQTKKSDFSGPNIEGKYADAFSKLIGGSFSSGNEENSKLSGGVQVNSSFGNGYGYGQSANGNTNTNTYTTTVTTNGQDKKHSSSNSHDNIDIDNSPNNTNRSSSGIHTDVHAQSIVLGNSKNTEQRISNELTKLIQKQW